MVIDQQSLDRLEAMLDGGPKKIVVVSHTNPDGDAIGSSLAWRRILEKKGHDARCVVPNKYPYFLDWMADISKVGVFKEDTSGEIARFIGEADLIFCLDFNLIGRLEGLGSTIEANTRAKCVLIDHHLDPPAGFDLVFSYPQECSTSYIVYKLIERYSGLAMLDYPAAEALYVGIMTDTGNFSYSNLSADLFRAVAHLVEKGVDIPFINTAIYNGFSESRVRLLGYALNDNMTVMRDYGVGFIMLRESELRRFRFLPGDSEGFVNYPLSIKGVRMSAMFLETRQFIRVSLRSRGDVDVNVFARKYFGGGGHRNAAGGKSFVDMAATVEHFRAAVREFFGPAEDDRK